MTFRVTAMVWRWPGETGWHFVTLDRELSARIKKMGIPYGAGFIKIRATIGTTSWETAFFPHTQSKAYLLSIKAMIRKKENIWEGDEILITFELL